MGGFSPVHMGLVLVIALLVFGPKKLPEIGRELGKAIREFKKVSREVMGEFHEAAEDRPYVPPAYDSYASASASARFAIAPQENGPAPTSGPAPPASPPPGAVERGASAAPVDATPASPAVGPSAAPGALTHEPEQSPAASERNS